MALEIDNPMVTKLKEKLGFDPTRNTPTRTAYQAALEKVAKERNDKLQAQVEEQIRSACDLLVQRDKAVKEFQKTLAKFDKGLGEVMKTLDKISNNNGVVTEGPGEEEQQTESQVT